LSEKLNRIMSSSTNQRPWAYYKASSDTQDNAADNRGNAADSRGNTAESRGNSTESRGNVGESNSANVRQRVKLALKPRTVSSEASPQNSAPSNSERKNNPFGAAKPREEVLASKGIDSKLVDMRFQKKASITHYSKSQEVELDAVRRELKAAENRWRDANEKELPEEEFRLLTEQKRKDLKDLMEKFALENSKDEDILNKNEPAKKLERPSERRKRLEQEQQNDQSSKSGGGYYDSYHGRGGNGGGDSNGGNSSYRDNSYGNKSNTDDDDDAYASFGKGQNNNGRKDSYTRQPF